MGLLLENFKSPRVVMAASTACCSVAVCSGLFRKSLHSSLSKMRPPSHGMVQKAGLLWVTGRWGQRILINGSLVPYSLFISMFVEHWWFRGSIISRDIRYSIRVR